MARKIPKLTVTRTTDSNADLTFPNRDAEEVTIYRSDDQKNQFSLLTTVTADSYSDSTLVAAKNYKYYIRMDDLYSSIEITEDHTDETPPYYTVAALGGASLSSVAEVYALNWTTDLTVNFTQVDDPEKGLSSIGKFTQ